MGFLLGMHRNGNMVSDRKKRRFDCPCCHKARPKSWMVKLLVVRKDAAEPGWNKETAVCRKCWQNIGQHYNDLGTGRYYVVPEEG